MYIYNTERKGVGGGEGIKRGRRRRGEGIKRGRGRRGEKGRR